MFGPPTIVSIVIRPTSYRYGDDVELICTVESNPDYDQVGWNMKVTIRLEKSTKCISVYSWMTMLIILTFGMHKTLFYLKQLMIQWTVFVIPFYFMSLSFKYISYFIPLLLYLII